MIQKMGAVGMECGDGIRFCFLVCEATKMFTEPGGSGDRRCWGLKDNPRSALWVVISTGQRRAEVKGQP